MSSEEIDQDDVDEIKAIIAGPLLDKMLEHVDARMGVFQGVGIQVSHTEMVHAYPGHVAVNIRYAILRKPLFSKVEVFGHLEVEASFCIRFGQWKLDGYRICS